MGTMGQGIAQVTASAGLDTYVFDPVADRAEQAVSAIAMQLEKLVAKGKMLDDERGRALAALTVSSDVADACEGADLTIEAAPEDMDVKVKLLVEAAAA